MRTFHKKVILITGASGNLGRSLCFRFAAEGASIVAVDYDSKALVLLEKELKAKGHDVLPLVADITSKAKCIDIMHKVRIVYGRLDGLVNNAGITHIQRFTEMDFEKDITRRVMDVNFFGAVNFTEASIDLLQKNKGFIINISSVAGFAPLLGRTAYAASKHALHGFFESLGAELREEGVDVLMVCPAFIQPPKDIAQKASSEANSIYQNKKTIGPTLDASQIASDILNACKKGKRILICGRTGKLSYFLRRFFPNLYLRIMTNKLKKEL